MFKSCFLLAVYCIFTSSNAHADPLRGLYIAGGAGVNFAASLTSDGGTEKFATRSGVISPVALGWAFGNGFRLEFEGNYRNNAIASISTLRVSGAFLPLASTTGIVANYGVMANLAYDFPVDELKLPFQPYLGGGIGYSRVNFNHGGGLGFAQLNLANNSYLGPVNVSYASAGSIAYQAFAGLSIPVPGVKGLEFTLEDRLMGSTRSDVAITRTATGNTFVNGVIPASAVVHGFNPLNDALLVGLRYTFAIQ